MNTIVDRAIQDIAQDPQRSLRKLVDMGQMFAKGPFQKHYIGVIQHMLENGGSPYYSLVRDTVRNTDRTALRTFGINVGWQSWTLGAERIRAVEAQENYKVPWSLTLRLEEMDVQDPAGCRRLLDEGRALGIYTYFLHCGASEEGLRLAADLARQAPECAFPLLLSPAVTEAWLEELSRCPNLLLLLDAGQDGWQAAADLLRSARRFFGYYICCGEQQAEQVLSGAWVRSLLGHGGSMAFCVPQDSCPAPLAARLHAYTEQARNSQQNPLMLVDYYRDILLVDSIISDSPRYLELLPDGRAATYSEGRRQPLPSAAPGESLSGFLRGRFSRLS